MSYNKHKLRKPWHWRDCPIYYGSSLEWIQDKYEFPFYWYRQIDKNIEFKQTSKSMTHKLNILALSSELNLPKRFVQAGLNNLFASIAFLLESNQNCVIELGNLGNLFSNNRFVYHLPMKIKNDNFFIKKKTVKALLGKYNEEITTKDQMDASSSKLRNYRRNPY